MQQFTAKQYLKIDIANSFGLDKKDWGERLAWFDANEGDLLSKLKEAAHPAMFYAGVKAWEDVKAGWPSGYPISLDATASGMQILSVLTGDRRAAQFTNVVDTGNRNDAYTLLFNAMSKRVGNKMQCSRADMKQAIMTAFYGSEAVPKEVFGEGKMLGVFFATLEEETPFIWELNKAFLRIWNPNTLSYNWVLPDNFHAHIKVMDNVQEDVQFMGETVATFRKENMVTPTGRSIGANVTHSLDGMIVRELVRRCAYKPGLKEKITQLIKENEYVIEDIDKNSTKTQMVCKLWDHYEASGFLSARILDYLDENTIKLVNTDDIQTMVNSMPAKPFKIIPVHDCFRVLPNYGNDLRIQYNLQLSLLAKSNMLGFILSQIIGKKVNVNKQDDFGDEILQADYALS